MGVMSLKFRLGDRVVRAPHLGPACGTGRVVGVVNRRWHGGRWDTWYTVVWDDPTNLRYRYQYLGKSLSLWEPADPTDDAHKRFTNEMRARHDAGKAAYGDTSWHGPMLKSIQDMREEAIDFANYAAHLYYKLDRLETAIREMKKKLEE